MLKKICKSESLSWFNLPAVEHYLGQTYVALRVAEVGVLAETAKYPSMLARSARLQIFATKNTVFYNCKFLQHKRCFFVLALTALR